MAVTYVDNTIVMTADNDALALKCELIGMQLEHTAAANAIIQDTAGHAIGTLRTTTSVLRDHQEWPKGIVVNGLVVETLSAGTVTFFLK